MDAESLHDLTAAYALQALDVAEERAYVEHLATCERCRLELGELSEAATAFAYAVEAPDPPPALRGRILARARAERKNVVPLRARWAAPVAAVAAVAAAAAIGIGIWASSLSSRLDRTEALQKRTERVASILSTDDLASRRFSFDGGHGKLVITPGGAGALVINGLKHAPAGRVYEAWVSKNGKPRPAGIFNASRKVTAFPLDLSVPAGAAVMVTQEKNGGTQVPTTVPLFRIQT